MTTTTASLLEPTERRALGFFKEQERAEKAYLPQGDFLVIRLDGKNFSRFTKALVKPFDEDFSKAMEEATRLLCESDAPVACAYTQSDETSLIIDQRGVGVRWFEGQTQKVLSLTASMMTASFTKSMLALGVEALPFFDARACGAFTAEEVEDYLFWRRKDAVKNSISMLAHHYFSNEALQGVSTRGRLEMLAQAGHPWEKEVYPAAQAGLFIFPKQVWEEFTYRDGRSGQEETTEALRTRWTSLPALSWDPATWTTYLR